MADYLQMGYEELKVLSYSELLEAKTQVEGTEPLDVDRYNVIVNTLAEKSEQQEPGTEEVSETKPSFEFIEKVDFDKLTGRSGINRLVQLFIDKTRGSVTVQLSEEFESRVASLTEGFDAERTNWEYQNKKLQESLQDVSESNLYITEEKNRYKLEAEELDRRFRALEAKYDEDIKAKDEEIKRLKDKEFDLQQQLASAPAPTVRKAIDVSAFDDVDALIREINAQKEEEDRRKEAEKLANRPRITNVRFEKEFGPGANTTRLAELVGTYPGIGVDGETIRIGTFDFNKFQVLDGEEAGRFRAEQAAAQSVEENHTPDLPMATGIDVPVIPVITVCQFQPSGGDVEQTDTGATDSGSTGSVERDAAVQEAVTRAEFEALKADVEALKAKVVA